MKRLPLGIQNLKEIIEGGYVYVDKTRYVYDLVSNAKHYFLSRPRRFGKSLLLDTIGEVLSGNKELFKDLWIYGSDYSFTAHPVIRLDMSRVSNETPDVLKKSIMSYLGTYYDDEGFDLKDGVAADAFAKLILLLNQKYNQRVAVLIDEYDKPILDHIDDVKTAAANRKFIRGFYGILKSMDPYLRFTFITGVSKFTKTSIFSGLNNLKDITMAEDYANICGIPVESLAEYFGDHIENLKTHKRFVHFDSIQEKILEWYDGYSWDGETKLLNPYSLINFFDLKRFSGFWYASGSPGFLIDLIKKKPESYMTINDAQLSEHMLDSVEIDNIPIEPLLFQTGYLTVQEVHHTLDDLIYRLIIPNKEVRRAFNLHILAALAESDDVRTGRMRQEINMALKIGDLQKMLDILRGSFASIPYSLHVEREAYYHSLFYTFVNVLGLDMDVEVSVSRGRVDAVIELENNAYVMEFKYERCPPDASDADKRILFDKNLHEAMSQIKDRGYHKKYCGSGKAVYQVAFAFLGRGDIEMLATKCT